MPTRTWFGGAVGVPRPVRMKLEDDQDAGEARDREQQRRDQRDAADEQQQLDRVGAVGLHLTTVLERSAFDEALGRSGGSRLASVASIGTVTVSGASIRPSARASASL